MSNNKRPPLISPHDPAIAKRNRRTVAFLCGGMFVLYNGFFAAVTALSPTPAASATRSFNYIKSNCFSVGERIESKAGYEMNVPLKTATCALTLSGSPGIFAGSHFSDKKSSPSP